MSNLKIGKALFTSFDGNRGPYSGEDSGGFTFRMDYRGAGPEQFPQYTVRALMGEEKKEGDDTADSPCCASGECRCSVEKVDLKGKMVFFGAVSDSLKDYYPMPHDDRERLLVTHAMATDQLMRSYFNGDEQTRYWTRGGDPLDFTLEFYGVFWGLSCGKTRSTLVGHRTGFVIWIASIFVVAVF